MTFQAMIPTAKRLPSPLTASLFGTFQAYVMLSAFERTTNGLIFSMADWERLKYRKDRSEVLCLQIKCVYGKQRAWADWRRYKDVVAVVS